MEDKKEYIKKLFPNLLKEIGEDENKIPINSVRSNAEAAERYASGRLPDVIDYLRRCKEGKEATEIIDYMEKRGEISDIYAKKLRLQLLQKGLKSFGKKKKEPA
jgi:hypothetical protein